MLSEAVSTEATTMRHEIAGKPRAGRGLKLAGLVALLVALGVVALGLLSRWHNRSELNDWTAVNSVPTVTVFHPVAESSARTLVLPGTLQAWYAAPIYARVPGYLEKWYQDIGARVKAGELLAVIQTPDLDQELAQAKADLVSAEAGQHLAQVTAARWAALLAKDAVSHQESDEKAGELATSTAAVNAAKAKVAQLEAEESFKRIIAPFAGIVTARRTDIGDLINAGAGGSSTELFQVSEVDKLRLYVSVPQSYSARIRAGAAAHLTVPEYPNRVFTAQPDTSAGAVSDSSGTELVELSVNNADGALQPGDYAQVSFTLPAGVSSQVRIPESAILFRSAGSEVGVIGPDGRHVELRQITIGTDNGAWVEVVSGLSPNDRVIDNPSDSLAEHEQVRVTQTETPNVSD